MGRKSKGTPVVVIGVDRWGYARLAAHLGVSVRTLKRYVVSGAVPQPVMGCGNRVWWFGEKLIAAKSGLQIPGTYDYRPNAREAKRVATIARNAALQEKGKRLRARRAAAAKRKASVTP